MLVPVLAVGHASGALPGTERADILARIKAGSRRTTLSADDVRCFAAFPGFEAVLAMPAAPLVAAVPRCRQVADGVNVLSSLLGIAGVTSAVLLWREGFEVRRVVVEWVLVDVMDVVLWGTGP